MSIERSIFSWDVRPRWKPQDGRTDTVVGNPIPEVGDRIRLLDCRYHDRMGEFHDYTGQEGTVVYTYWEPATGFSPNMVPEGERCLMVEVNLDNAGIITLQDSTWPFRDIPMWVDHWEII